MLRNEAFWTLFFLTISILILVVFLEFPWCRFLSELLAPLLAFFCHYSESTGWDVLLKEHPHIALPCTTNEYLLLSNVLGFKPKDSWCRRSCFDIYFCEMHYAFAVSFGSFAATISGYTHETGS